MKSKYIIGLTFVLLLGALIIFLMVWKTKPVVLPVHEETQTGVVVVPEKKDAGLKQVEGVCYTRETVQVEGASMEPLIASGTEKVLMKNYYNCHDVEKEDIVVYNFLAGQRKLIKRVVATPSDTIQIKDGKLVINDEELKTTQGESYAFTEPELKVIGMYLTDGKLPQDSYLIFGEDTSGSIDSRRFGAVSSDDFLGKIEK